MTLFRVSLKNIDLGLGEGLLVKALIVPVDEDETDVAEDVDRQHEHEYQNQRDVP